MARFKRHPTKLLAVAAGLYMTAAAPPQPLASTADRPLVVAQAGFTFGSRDDLGPRYDPYSERWENYRPSDPCRWVPVRTRLANGKVVLRQQWVCGFKVPAR